jgi:hypothetical protein
MRSRHATNVAVWCINYRRSLTNLAVLALDPDDQDALQTKLWLLFKTNAYTQALDVTQSRPSEFDFELAYALYRLQRETEGAGVLAGLGESHRAAALLEAQIVSCSLNSLGISCSHLSRPHLLSCIDKVLMQRALKSIIGCSKPPIW